MTASAAPQPLTTGRTPSYLALVGSCPLRVRQGSAIHAPRTHNKPITYMSLARTENHFQMLETLAMFGMAGAANLEKIDAARAARRVTGTGEFGAEEGIDDAGFADVGAAEECDFGQ
jgi:hypothetical protein